jgi:TonB family protein
MRDGRIVNIRVLRSTNDPILDGLAVRALEATASLPPLPDTFKEDQVELIVLFDYSPSVEQGGSVNP